MTNFGENIVSIDVGNYKETLLSFLLIYMLHMFHFYPSQMPQDYVSFVNMNSTLVNILLVSFINTANFE